MLYQLSYTRVSAGSGTAGKLVHCSRPFVVLPTPLVFAYFPASPLSNFPASMVGVGFEPT